jgi:hypothetical protein
MSWEALESEVTEPVRYSTAELYLRREREKTKSERLPELIRKASSMGLFEECEHGAGGIARCKRQEAAGENTEWTTTLMEIVDNLEVTGDIITKPEELAETMMERRTRRRVTHRDDDGTVTVQGKFTRWQRWTREVSNSWNI